MTIFKCSKLLSGSSWQRDVFVQVTPSGVIEQISQKPGAGTVSSLDGYVIPGFQNGHSHSFQYAMGGVAEFMPARATEDDFWTWREAMYNLALTLSPDQLEAITAMVYAEMLRNGTTHVVEFHYLHNDPKGKRYANEAELSQRIIAAAATAGIELTIVPVFYRHGGFGKSAEEKQRRFLCSSVTEYLALVSSVRNLCRNSEDVVCGTGVHSLRAADPTEIREIIASRKDGPFHLHIAEQQKEIDDCLKHLGKRPVEWVLDEFAVDKNFCFTHATHMTSDETRRLARSGANVVICPSTEGNLGDGFFNLLEYRSNGGSYTIGSDSHIGLSPFEELRWLDYVQRLRLQKRNIICDEPLQDSAATLLRETWTGGRRTRGDFNTEFFGVGKNFDCVVVDPEHPAMLGKPDDRALGAMTYCGDSSAIKQVIRRGKAIVENGRHIKADLITSAYKKALK